MPGNLPLSPLEERGEMQHEEHGHEVDRNQHERQLSHGGGRYPPGTPHSQDRTQCPEAHSIDDVQNPEQIQDDKEWTARKAGSADQGEHHPRRGDSYGYIAQAGRPGEGTWQSPICREGYDP